MRVRKLQHILTLALLLWALFFAAPSASAAATTEEMQQMLQIMPMQSHAYSYSGKSASTYYSHALLFQDSSTISPDLAKSSLALSVSAYSRGNVNSLLKSMDFEPKSNEDSYNKNSSGLTVTDCDYVAYTIATKEITHPLTGKPYILYCIPIQGTKAPLEWLNDFNMGSGTEHEGFRKASLEIYVDLTTLFNADGYAADSRILWFTGHSRGAACANLLAGWFSGKGSYYVTQENLFAYTFACPAVSKNADISLSNIFNFNNPGDLVPMLPLPEWDYKRYGQTIELDTSIAGYGNFNYRYASIMGKTYPGEINGENYRSVLSEIGKLDETQFVLDLVAWALGGGDTDDLKEIIKKDLVDEEAVLKTVIKKIPSGNKIVKIAELLDLMLGTDKTNEELISWCQKAYEDTESFTTQEFNQYLQKNATTIQKLENICGFSIVDRSDFTLAKNALVADSRNALRLAECISAAMDLICDDNGNIADKVIDAHTQPAYTIWINSMFYGYAGWYNNDTLTSISLDSCTFRYGPGYLYDCGSYFSIGENCFYDCDDITSINIPDTVTQVGSYAFANCNGAIALTIPADLQYGNAFYNVDNIQTIHYTKGSTGILPSRELSYNYMGFYYTTALEYYSRDSILQVDFAEGITQIGNNLFYNGTTSMTTVSLPSTLEYIGWSAFQNCGTSAELDIWFTGNAPVIQSSSFSGTTANCYYPDRDDSWTEDVMQNYGGTLTWKIYCTQEHSEQIDAAVPPTCTAPGLTEGKSCSVCGMILIPQEEIPVTGKHTYDEPAFTWAEDFSCTALFTCKDCQEPQTLNCTVTSQTIPAEGDKPAQILYTATVTLCEVIYTDTQTVDVPHIHTPEPRWQHDQTSHWKQCTGCEEKLETADHTFNTYQTCTICGFLNARTPELNWFFDKLNEPDNTLWATGYYVKIMEQYGKTK